MIKLIARALREEALRQRIDPIGAGQLLGAIPPVDWEAMAQAALDATQGRAAHEGD